MESLFILIPIALVIIIIAVVVFFWAVKSGQFEDLDAEGKRILFDETPVKSASHREQKVDHIDDGNGPSDKTGAL